MGTRDLFHTPTMRFWTTSPRRDSLIFAVNVCINAGPEARVDLAR